MNSFTTRPKSAFTLAALLLGGLAICPARAADHIQRGEMAGYLLVPNEKVPDAFNAGFSMYVAAWPLLKTYPGSRFQTGLFGTWMFAQEDKKPDFKMNSDIEGGRAGRSAFNEISQKHLDFVVCRSGTWEIVCGIELDDGSHRRTARTARDFFVEVIFSGAGIPLVRVPVRSSYSVRELREKLGPMMRPQGMAMAA